MTSTITPAASLPPVPRCFEHIRLRGDYGEYCIDLLGRATRLGYNVVEVPYVCVPRTAGDSKTGANLVDYLVKGRKYVSAASGEV